MKTIFGYFARAVRSVTGISSFNVFFTTVAPSQEFMPVFTIRCLPLFAKMSSVWPTLFFMLFPHTVNVFFFLLSIDKVSKVASPVLVIHGTEDEVIDFSHGLAMYERCPRAVEPLWVEGAGHNDIELYAQYLERLKQFISFELSTSWGPWNSGPGSFQDTQEVSSSFSLEGHNRSKMMTPSMVSPNMEFFETWLVLLRDTTTC